MKNRKGFTLIEILAVIIIMGIIMIIAIPSVTKYIFKTDRQVYVSNLSAYAETIRAKYEMREYGSYLQDDEIMVVPIKTVILEKGDNGESPYGEYDLERSYVIVVPENNKYNFYITAIDDTNTGIIEADINTMDESSIKSEINTPIQTVPSFEVTGTIYKFKGKDYRKTENREIEGEDVNTSPDMKTYVFKYLGVEPENTTGIYKITLDNQGATTHGTEFIYQYYSVGWYSDSEGTTTIRTITPPFKNGYAFNGYYTGANGTGQLIINATGIIVLGTEKTFTTNGTLYAKWTECENGYYSNDSLTCSICPEGYRDGTLLENKTAINKCLKNVGAGKYIKNARDVNPSTCGANTFANKHTVTYGGTSVCPACTTLGSIYTNSDGGTKDTGCYSNVPAGKYIKNGKDTAYSTCNANNYSNGAKVYYGEVSSCIPCVTLGLQYTKSEGGTADTGCYMTVSAGKYKTVATGITTANCAANKYSIEHTSYYKSTDENSCKACPSGYTSAEGSKTKDSCKITCGTDTRVGTIDGKCTTTCTGGTTIAGHTVSAGSTSANCGACTNGTGVYAWGTTGCTIASCKAGYAKSNNSCVTCAGGTISSNGNTGACSACGAGKYTTDHKTCGNITAGCYGTSAGSACPAKCPAGTYSAAGASSCTTCGTGEISGEGASSCSACGAGKYTTDHKTCGNISAGCYGTSAGSACPAKCPAGTYSDAGKSSCTTCGTGSISGEGASSCSACGAGKYTTDHKSCGNISAGCYGTSAGSACPAKCGAGTYSATGKSSCTTCGTGAISGEGASSCSACGAGKYTTDHKSCGNISAGCYGTSAGSACPAKCPAGTYSAAGKSSCTTCGTGAISGEGASSCSACGAGKYTTDHKSCGSISAGCYGTSAGSACPAKCGAGTYSAAGASSCSACGAGSTSGEGAGSCTACSNATGVASWSSGCTIASCSAGYYLTSNSCAACKIRHQNHLSGCVNGQMTLQIMYVHPQTHADCGTVTKTVTCTSGGGGGEHNYNWEWANNHSTVAYCRTACPGNCANRGHAYWTCTNGANWGTPSAASLTDGIYCWCGD